MKVRFFSLLAVLILVIVGFIIYLSLNKEDNTSKPNDPVSSITAAPTVAPQPTLTPVPSDYENAPGVYPAYQTTDGNQVYGYIDPNGEFSIKPSFDIAGDFHEGIATVQMEDQYLAIDTTGTILYYSENPIKDFHNGAAVISRNSGEDMVYGYIDTDGKEIIKPLYKIAGDFGADDTAYVYKGDGKYAQIDRTGKELNQYEIDKKYSPYNITDGYVIYYNSKSNLYGVLNLKGEEIFAAKYIEINYLGYNIFALKKPNDEYFGMYSELPSALFYANGEKITDDTLYDVTAFYNGYSSATDSTHTFFIGMDGKEITTLPAYEGRGTVKLFGDVVKAEIDRDLIYSRTDGTVIWQNPVTQAVSDTVTVTTTKLKPCKYVLVYYPQVEGLTNTTVQDQINAKLRSIFTDARVKMTEKDMYMVEDSFKASLIKNLLIIERDGYDYPFGAAHGSPIMDYSYIDTTTGALYQLKDLFIESSDYINFINNKITDDIATSKADNSMYFENGFTGIRDNQTFILTPDTLTIYFYPADIAAYAAGFPKFDLPIDDLYDYIDFNSAFWQSYH